MLNCVKWIEKAAYGKLHESLSRDLTKIIPIFPENLKILKIRVRSMRH